MSEISPDELLAALAHRERQIDAIRRINEALFSRVTVDDTVRETLIIAIDVLRADAGSVQLHDPTNDTLIFRYVVSPVAMNLEGYAMPVTQGIAGHVFRTGASDLTHRVSEHARFNPEVDQATGYTTRSMMTVPLKRLSGDSIGTMQILNSISQFDRRDLEVLEVIGAQAAAAIENARLAQQARQAEVVNVIGDVAHDIKNMLTPIQVGITMLEPMIAELYQAMNRAADDVALADYREHWLRCSKRLGRDYGRILRYALDSADKVQARTKQIADAVKGELAPPVFDLGDLNETLRDVARILAPFAERQHVEIKLDLGVLPEACFDSQQMYNAVFNLVNNAIPETPAGGSITLRTQPPAPGHEYLAIEVADTGRGMTDEVRLRLFTAAAISTKRGGTGLGTRIVADVVERHQGTIEVHSTLGEGTCFTIHLPLNAQDSVTGERSAEGPVRTWNDGF